MLPKYTRIIRFSLAAIILLLLIWYAQSVFLLGFASILLAIFLNTLGKGAAKITRLPYTYALSVALIVIVGGLTLVFWLYSPLIADQFQLLTNQIPQSLETVRSYLARFVGNDFLSQGKLAEEFSLSNQKIVTQILSVFSTTLGSIGSFVIFLIVGLYLAFDPMRYANWVIKLVPPRKQKKVSNLMNMIGQSLSWWILGKILSMLVVGIFTFIGLSLLHVSLAFILGIIAALLTFVPYVGAILAGIPAVLIALTQSPLKALYVIILYTVIHIIDGYFITPSIEQRTVSIPPAISIMAQVLMVVLIGGIGLALATPLAVVGITLAHAAQQRSTLKVAQQPQQTHND